MKRKPTILLTAILFAAIIPFSALAAAGDVIIVCLDPDSFNDYIERTCVVDETLYLMGEQALYTWRIGDADTTTYPWDDFADRSGNEYDEKTQTYSHTDYSRLALFANGDQPCAVLAKQTTRGRTSALESITLNTIVLKDGKACFEEIGELDWEPMMEYYDDSAYPKTCEGGAIAIDGTLYALVYGDNGDLALYSVPLNGGYAKLVEEVEFPYAISAYTDGKLLIEQYAYTENGRIAFLSYDPASETVERLCEMDAEEDRVKNGVVYSPESGLVYFVESGCVKSLNLETLETVEVNYMPGSVYGGGYACMLPGGFYVMTGNIATAIRNTDPSLKSQYRLTIYNGSYADSVQQTHYEFADLRGDVSVVMLTNNLEPTQIVETMMNRSPDMDIYVLANGYWSISPESIEWYRQYADYLMVESYNPFYSDRDGEIWSLMQQYYAGSISVDQFLQSADQKVRMMALEGN